METAEWIKVEKGLPEPGVRVLAFTSYAGVEQIHTAEYYRGIWSGDDADLFNVTHWMQLPKPPKS